jgi:hypothetical protein
MLAELPFDADGHAHEQSCTDVDGKGQMIHECGTNPRSF